MNPSISVVIGTHNHAHFLPECLQSVKKQTFQDYEVIVVDNGSTDDTKTVVESLAWDKLRYHYQQDTGSIAGSRNTGTRLAHGEYVAFLDSDDAWHTDKLEKIVKLFEDHPEIDLITHNLIIKQNGKVLGIGRVGPGHRNMFKRLLFYENCIAGSATMVKRNALLEVGGFDERKEFVNAEDYETWLRMAYSNKKFLFLAENLGEYRIHNENVSNDFALTCPNEINVIRKHFKNYKSNNPTKYVWYGKVLGVIYLRLGHKHLRRKQYGKGIENIFKSFVYSPLCLHLFQYGINYITLHSSTLWELLYKDGVKEY